MPLQLGAVARSEAVVAMVLRGRHENDAGSLERCALADGGAEERGDAREGSALK